MASTMRIPTEFTAIDKFSSVVQKMTSGVNGFSKTTTSAVQRVNSKVNGMFNSLDSISQIAIGGGVSAGFLIAGKAVMDYEDALASLEAVTGEKASKFKAQIESIAKTTGKSAIDVAGSFEIIGSAMSQYLSDPKSLGQISEAGIVLSKAAKMELEPALESLTSAMNQFNLGSEKAMDTVNRLTAGEIVGSVSTAKATEQLSKFGAVANSVNVSLPESVALIQTLGKKFTGSMQSEIGTAAKNLLLIMDASSTASKGASYSLEKNGVSTKILMDRSISLGARLKELSKIKKDGAAMSLVFGKENSAAGNVIFDQLDTYVKWEEQIRKTNKAQEQARVNSATLSKTIEFMKNSFINSIVSGEKNNTVLDKLKKITRFVADNMQSIIGIVGGVIAVFAVFKTIVTIIKIATGIQAAYNAVMLWYDSVALTAALTGSSFAAVIWATVWPILAVIAAIGAIIAIFYYWDEIVAWFSKQWETFTNWIGTLWDGLVSWFQNFSFVDFFMQIGQSIIDFMLLPLRGVMELMSKIPGKIGEMAKGGLAELDKINITQALESPEGKQAKATANASVNGKVAIDVSAKGGATAEAKSSFSGGIPVMVTPTQGAFGK